MNTKEISWGQRIGFVAIGAFAMLLVMLFCFAMVPKLSSALVQNACTKDNCDNDSSIAIAGQMGRLDVISLALGMTGIGVGAFAIFGFFAIKDHTEAVATHVAKKTANDTAEKVASEKIDLLKTTMLSNFSTSENTNTLENLTSESKAYEDENNA